MDRIRNLGFVLLAVALLLAGQPVAAQATEPTEPVLVTTDNDVRNLIGPNEGAVDLQATDPLGLLPRIDTLREHSLGVDRFDVWTCDLDETPEEVMALLAEHVSPWFQAQSRGRYKPIFTSKGVGCIEDAVANASSSANAAVIVGNYVGSAQILTCPNGVCAAFESFPSNYRYAYLGISHLGSNAVHEIGHLIRWMHSYSGQTSSQYDNAADVMSGNYGIGDLGSAGTYPLPYGTAPINRYSSGWIDTDEVAVITDDVTLTLSTPVQEGIQMAVIRAGNSYYTLDARVPSDMDPIREAWAGVAIHKVTQTPFPDGVPGFRRVAQHPPTAFNPADFSAYDEPLPSILGPGQKTTLAGTEVAVVGSVQNGFRVQFGEGHDGTFIDDDGSSFEGDIEAIAKSGVTRGCNPPVNDMFCPKDEVTREQMAAFIVRAMGLADADHPGFTDVAAGSTFETDIKKLAKAGITRGCNPPTNDRFCPDDEVSRQQMAAFIVRALGLTDADHPGFTDVAAGSTFETDIEKLAKAGITRGCNPPTNDRFCPGDDVTREQMAAFMNRAGWGS